MTRLLLKAASALLCAVGLPVFASTTNVTATLVDGDGVTWANCSWTAVVSSPVPPTIAGVPVPDASLRANGSCSSSGALSATMLDTSSVQQAGVTWTFTIQPNASSIPTVVTGVSVTGASISLSSVLSAALIEPRFNAGPKAYGYADIEVNSPVFGDTYFNTAAVCGGTSLRQFSNAGWQCGGSGGGGGGATFTPTGIQFATSSTAATVATGSQVVSALQSAVIPPANLGSGTASGGTFLAGDSTYKTLTLPVSGAGAPTATCAAGQVYTQTDAQTFPVDQSKWTCSKNAMVWQNAATGAVVTAVSNAYVASGALGFYELQETSGSTFADTSGNGNTLTNGSTPVTFNGGNGVNLGSNRFIALPAAWLANGNTYMACGDFRANTTSNPLGVIISPGPSDGKSFGFDGSGRMGIRNTSSNQILIGEMSSAFIPQMPGCVAYSASNTGTSTLVSGTVAATSYIENVPMTVTAQAALGLGAWPTGGNFGPPNGAKLYKFYAWNRTLDIDEIQEMAIAATAKLATQGITLANGFTSPVGPQLLALGDSQTAGVSSVSNPPGYPPMLAALMPGGTNLVNMGIASAQSANVTLEAAQVSSILASSGSPVQRIGILWGQTNDIFAGKTAAQAFTAYSAIAVTMKQASLKTVVLTTLPSTRCVTTCETNRQTLNSTWATASVADGLVDIGDDLRFSNPQFTPFLASDGLHPVDIGYAVIAGRVLTELNRIRAVGDIGVVPVAYSATPNFDLSKGVHQSILLTGNVTKFTVTNFNQGTNFQIDFIQDATGGRTVGIGVVGSGAAATAPLTGAVPVFTLGSGGSNYSSAYPPIIVASGGTCTTYPKFVAVITAGAVSAGNGTGTVAGNCSVAPTLTFVSTEPTWHGTVTFTTTASTTTTQNWHFDSIGQNVYANNQTAQ